MSEFEDHVRSFCQERSIQALIAVSGTAEPNPFAEQVAVNLIERLHGYPVGIITSGTKTGVPGCTFRCARQAGLSIVRLFPEYAPQRGHLHEGKADLEIPIPPRAGPSMWGDESGLFVKLANGIVFIGGGSGTLLEIATWAKVNKTLFGRPGAKTIPAVPVALGEGWSQWLAQQGLASFGDSFQVSVPTLPISTGSEAAVWILGRLHLLLGDPD